MNNDALTLIPARVRQAIYVGLTVVSLLLTAAGAVFAAGPYPAPWWIAGALTAVGILAAPFGVLAAANVQPDAYPEQVIVRNGDDEPKVLS